MNRHHPYGGSYDGPRRGGHAGNFGPGPDRSHRYDRGGAPRGRGFGRGRGGGGGGYQGSYGGYNNSAPYNQGPPQGDMGGYNNYQSGPPQDQYYQNGNYAAPAPGQYDAPDFSGGYDQSYGYEDGADQNYNQGGGYGRFQKRPQRRERDDKVHDSIIEERLQRERPCRTLFIRNIKYETNSDDVRRLFEEHGEIKTFFDLIANRGMVFVTFYDLRAAERARDRLQGSEISGRPIDVHYSLPRDDHGKGADRQREQELQGTLIVTLRNSQTNQPIDDGEVRRKFQQFGDVKSVRPVGDRLDQRYVEYYDTRAAEDAHDRLRHQGLQDGVMEIVFAYTGTDDPGPAARQTQDDHGGFDRQRDWEEPHNRARRGGRGGRGRGRGYGGGDWEDRRDWNNKNRDRNSQEDEFGRTQRGGESNNRFNKNGSGGYGGSGSGPSYGSPPSPGYGQASSAPAEAADERERLEQAKKVQQLLAALKQPGASVTPAPPPAPAPAPPAPAPPAMPQMQPPPTTPAPSYYHQPPMNVSPQAPAYGANPAAQPPNPYALQQQASTPQVSQQQGGPAAPMAGLPPNILALLQQGSQAQQPSAQTSAPPPMPPYSMPPASAMIGAQQPQQPPQQQALPAMSPPNPSQVGYRELMAYLQAQNQKR
ncbi:hypothetical protein BD413DRAFT_114435 [Trametes elegans]|nr:hypothetical protein BD413DRAFT_114435 [Trametes elegans]